MAWIEVHTNLPRHGKLLQLQSLLKLTAPQALGHLVLLWIWALENSADGSLGRLNARGLAHICQFSTRRAEEFARALETSGFLDRDENGLRIHDWEEYAGRYMHIRRSNAERKRRQRSRETSVTVTEHKDQTRPDQTGQDQTGQDQKDSSGAGGGEARARAQLDEFLARRGLETEALARADGALLAACSQLTEELFRSLCTRPPTELDRTRVFACVTRQTGDGGRVLDEDRRDLLLYAFEQAAAAGKPGAWPYIEAVLGRLHCRGLATLSDAEDYDLERA